MPSEDETQIITFLASISKKKVTSTYLQRIAQQLIQGNQQKATLIEQMVTIAKGLPEFKIQVLVIQLW